MKRETLGEQDDYNSKVITLQRTSFALVNRFKPLKFQKNKQAEA